ncbi:hypothetical protein BVC80_1651g18 [Macleaya cordata]|uniref:Uncharacterized protein n=1 Tax=Macleaya cordata TaxID=56857 RepID=A0A200PZ60_MACCD|nr:hypothetical protein BVC80_1651g18 [Macleaya cordata]
MDRSFSPSRSPGSARLQFGAVSQRLRSSSFKKPPEPLRRAVADCLSSSSSSHHGNPSTVASEAARTLRDYIAASSTTDLAYSVIIDHALAERERSPQVVARCVALLKRYLLRYVPSEQTLQQIDQFCINSILECDSSTNRRVSPLSKSLSQQSGASVASANAFPPSSPASSIASGASVKSLNYIRSLLARHIPKRSFQPATFALASTASKQSLPSLSSFLSKSFNSQLGPAAVSVRESPDRTEASILSVSNVSTVEVVEGKEGTEYISIDVLKWRWAGDQQLSLVTADSDGVTRPQDISSHSFLEVGAAALLVGEMEAKMKGQPWKHSGTQDIPDPDQLLQPSTVTTATNFASARSHLRAITASKRTKPGPHQIWHDSQVSTFRPRSRPLFQYRHYSEQQPLRLNPAEVYEVITAVCSEASSPKSNLMTVSSRLSNNSGKPSMDVAVSVLIKLVIDMYVLDSQTAAPLTLSMLEEMLRSPRLASRVRAFDLILNLGVHAHLLEPMLPDDPPTIEEESSQELYPNNEGLLATEVKGNSDSCKQNGIASAIDKFESWLLSILHEILLLLVQTEEKEETVWASALSCLLYFVCDRGQIWRSRLEGLDIRVIKGLLEISREHSWAELVHCKLLCMLTNMFYQVSDGATKAVPSAPIFLIEQVDLLGGIEFICLEYSQANSREEKRNLFLVLFDYVLHQINETCLATGDSEYNFEEIQPLATMLTLADAPEAFYIAVKHGVEGIGEVLRGSISAALSRYPNSERLNVFLEKITGKLDTVMSSFGRLDGEFSDMIRITKSYKSLESIEDETLEHGIRVKGKLSWATLHSLLHSERSAYRQNGYIWLVELLLAEISDERDESIWSNIRNLQQQIGLAGSRESSISSGVPLPIWILCGLLKSKNNFIRRGFLFVLEKLLLRFKLLLDENELQHSNSNEVVAHNHGDIRLEKANAVIDIMSSALSLVVQINETDRINILKICDMLFSQLCLRLLSAPAIPLGDLTSLGKVFGCTDSLKHVRDTFVPTKQEKNHILDDFPEETISKTSSDQNPSIICKTASLAALLLRGQAIVPMQLVSRVPTPLLYWPLIQLASAATDDIALGVAVGSKGRGNLPGATSDIRAALLLLLIGKCTADAAAFQEVGGEEFFRELLDDTDSRVAYYSSAFLLKACASRMMTEEPEKYQRILQSLIFRAQQSNNEKLLENPYLQIRGILQLSNDLGTRFLENAERHLVSILIYPIYAETGSVRVELFPLIFRQLFVYFAEDLCAWQLEVVLLSCKT